MPVHQLILFPHRRDIRAEQRERLVEFLQRSGFLDGVFTLDGRRHFLTGRDFLSQLIFLGCSPYIEIEPPAASAEWEPAARRGGFCHIHITPALEQPAFRANPQGRGRCPACRQSVPAATLLASPQSQYHCEKCGNAAAIEAWEWRQNAGFSNLFIEVWGIHPGEAAPTEAFLQALETETDSPWSFFYTQS